MASIPPTLTEAPIPHPIVEEDTSGWESELNDVEQGGNTTAQAAHKERETLAKDETVQVHRLRLVTLSVLIITATVVTFGVYFVSRKSQNDSFESEYKAHASKIISNFHSSVGQYLASLDSFSAGITSYAKQSGSTFPNVTIPDFEVLGATSRILSQSTYLQYSPLVRDEERAAWEAYANETYGFLLSQYMTESTLKDIQDTKYGYNDRKLQLVTESNVFRDQIWGTTGDSEVEPPDSGPYFPIWQTSPTIPYVALLNFNSRALEYLRGPTDEVLGSGMATLGYLNHLNDDEDDASQAQAIFDSALAIGQLRHKQETFQNDPLASLTYPVFDSFSIPDRKVCGTLATTLYWRLLLADILPPGANGFVVVIENTLGQSSSYSLSGPDVVHLGNSDLHDKNFDHLKVSADVAEYLASTMGPDTTSFTAVDLNSDYTNYRLSVYPSQTTKDDTVTNSSIGYALGVASIFAFTALMFLFYNRLVERRQDIVLDKAAKSTAVVKSLFPEQVHNRLYEETEESTDGVDENNEAAEGRLTKFLAKGEVGAPKSKPIADLFPECTVFFADLAGFTKWSATRDAVQVFGLLETLYSNFDRIAKHRKVFKVETIGDCYVAITGCPSHQEDHGVIMAKFARDCLGKVAQLLPSLAEDYGSDTLYLSLRVGLHSGPVTGGVLRGDRSRFQLFGDTVNTAARMESNGIPGNIHCSQTTADELILMGKSSWLKPREETIVAKGKGRMQTYWIDVPNSTTNTMSIVSRLSVPSDGSYYDLDIEDGFNASAAIENMFNFSADIENSSNVSADTDNRSNVSVDAEKDEAKN